MVIYSLWIQSPCQMMIGVYNHLLRKVFRFHYHSQKVIGSLGIGYVYFKKKHPSKWDASRCGDSTLYNLPGTVQNKVLFNQNSRVIWVLGIYNSNSLVILGFANHTSHYYPKNRLGPSKKEEFDWFLARFVYFFWISKLPVLRSHDS